ncbi:MAG: hypothetical protein OXI41_14030 [Chloroflexota bacterium]|nr:hypothetical protein [Chloroflexota bacterium]
MDPEQVTQQIRFALAELPTQNAHHTFEHICRRLTEQFICSNVLPATGPVSAGGDQGRDFETFRSFLKEELGPSGGFLGLISDGPIVFICTTQADNIFSKLQSDIDKVLQQGSSVSAIRAFTLNSLPVGARHRLQDEVREQWGIELEVHDAESIADLLSRHEGFWIAERYLSMPSEVRPSRTAPEGTLDEDYVKLRNRWHKSPTPQPTIGDFISLKAGVREATSQEEARPDLPFWLGLLREFLSHSSLSESLRQRARYELVVASLRGAGDLRSVDDVVRHFLSASLDESEPARLEDAAVLLQYATGAVGHDVSAISLDELRDWHIKITARVQELLPHSRGHRRAALLDVLGFLGMCRRISEEHIAQVQAAWDDTPPQANVIFADPSIPPAVRLTEHDFMDLQSAVSAWTELAEMLEDTPLFPVDHLSKLLGILAPALIDVPEWRTLADLVDQAVERTSGKSAVAARARDRAFALLKADRRLDAIEEFHKVKLDWWSGDTIRGSLLAMLMLSKTYLELRLPLAAKSHALGAAFVAATHNDSEHADLVAQGLSMAACADVMSGAWCGATELYQRAIEVQYAVGDSTPDSESIGWFAEPDLHLTYITECAGVIDGQLLESVQAITTAVGVDDVVDMALSTASPDHERRWASFGGKDLTGPPFSDLGVTRHIRFSGLGTDWLVVAANDAKTNRMAERFAAGAQVMLAALASQDLCLVPTQISVNVERRRRRSAATGAIESLPSNDGRKWTVRLTPFEDATDVSAEELTDELVSVLAVIFREASLLPDDDFATAIKRAFQRGLTHELFPPRPYDELAAAFAAEDKTEIRRGVWETPWSAREGDYGAHMELAWNDGLGPTYSEEKAQDLLKTRYQNLAQSLRTTIPKLRNSAGFLRTVNRLRSEEGWLDWHVLTAVLNATMSYRFPVQTSQYPSDTLLAQMQDAAYSPEPEDARVIPAYRLTPRVLREARQFSMLALVQIWGLEIHQSAPDLPAIERLLAARYGYWTDDLPHDDPFPNTSL